MWCAGLWGGCEWGCRGEGRAPHPSEIKFQRSLLRHPKTTHARPLRAKSEGRGTYVLQLETKLPVTGCITWVAHVNSSWPQFAHQ